VIRMRIHDELHFTEIAEILDIPVTTAKSRFAYGISKLRRLLSAESDS
ncbi:MAG: RNA polymerase subunit sigma, partial [Alistipes sp.]|nr:RNA polymerase subunit sigma [Alistipes sp.]